LNNTYQNKEFWENPQSLTNARIISRGYCEFIPAFRWVIFRSFFL